MGKLTVGDKVMWKGAWGKDIPKEATVTDMDVWDGNQLVTAKEANWDLVTSGRDVVVSLDNGFWAYGFQLTQL